MRAETGAVKLLVDAQPSVIGPLLEALDSNGDTPLAVAVFHCAKLDERNAESGMYCTNLVRCESVIIAPSDRLLLVAVIRICRNHNYISSIVKKPCSHFNSCLFTPMFIH